MSNIFAWAIDGMLEELRRVCLTDTTEWNRLLLHIDDPASDEGVTALHYACRYGRTEFALFLINEMNANLYAKQINGYTALHEASIKNHVSTIEALVRAEHSKSPSPCLISMRDNNGNTPLMEACFWVGRDCGACRVLLSLGADSDE